MKTKWDLVILIDCWPLEYSCFDKTRDSVEKFYHRLQRKLSTMRYHRLALASYPGSGEETDIRETDEWLMANLKSQSHGPDVDLRQCETFQDIYKWWPELASDKKGINVLIGGQAYWHCVLWRPIGFIAWLNQQNEIHTCLELLHNDQPNQISHGLLMDDKWCNWQPKRNCDDGTYYATHLRWEQAIEPPPQVDYSLTGKWYNQPGFENHKSVDEIADFYKG